MDGPKFKEIMTTIMSIVVTFQQTKGKQDESFHDFEKIFENFSKTKTNNQNATLLDFVVQKFPNLFVNIENILISFKNAKRMCM